MGIFMLLRLLERLSTNISGMLILLRLLERLSTDILGMLVLLRLLEAGNRHPGHDNK